MTILVLAVALNDVHGGTCTVDEQCVDADACTRDVCSAGRCTYPAVAFGDVDADALVAVPDIICILDGFAGSFEICGLSAADLSPCTQDGVIDLDDVLAGLDACAGLTLAVDVPQLTRVCRATMGMSALSVMSVSWVFAPEGWEAVV